MFIPDPPSRMPRFWSPWACVCGAGGTGADAAGAQHQYDLHMLGAWPALIEWAPGYHPFVTPDGTTVYVQDST